MLGENLNTIRRRIAAACVRAGREPETVTLVAVSKTFDSGLIREAAGAGVRDFGENFVQELLKKRNELLSEDLRWHFVGHLQSNKAKSIAGWIHLIHSVDSLNLGAELSKRAREAGRTIDLLLEVNSTGEKTKFGVRPQEVPGLAHSIARLPNLNVAGLMTIGPFLPHPEDSRPSFRLMRDLRERLQAGGFSPPHLSMGMSSDFEVAIEEGATIIRLGTAIFGPRPARDERQPPGTVKP